MTTQYPNQSVQYSDLSGNTATLTPNIGLVLSNGVTNLTMDQTGFTNGVQTLLFQDIYTTVGKTESIKYLSSTPTKISVVDTIEVVDDITTPTYKSELIPTSLTITEIATSNYASYGYNEVSITDVVSGETTTVDKNSITMTAPSGGFNQIIISNDISVNEPFIRLDDSLGVTNTLDHDKWTGNILSQNTTANLVHYLGFFDASGTGYGHPQKTALLSCNPALSIISATTFSGNATSSSTAVGVNLTSDNTAGTYFLTFSKTATATGNSLFIDNVTGPLTYNPSTSTMSASYFSGDEIRPTSQNTATYAGSTLSISGASNGQNVSTRNSSVVITGGSGSISALTLTNMVVNGTYKIGILNSTGSNLTINTGLGANIRTIYSSGFNVSNGRYALMTIDCIVINGTTQYIVGATQLTN